MEIAEVEALIKLMRERGVLRLKCGDVDITLAPESGPIFEEEDEAQIIEESVGKDLPDVYYNPKLYGGRVPPELKRG